MFFKLHLSTCSFSYQFRPSGWSASSSRLRFCFHAASVQVEEGTKNFQKFATCLRFCSE